MSARVRIACLILLTILASGVRGEGLRYLSADALNVVELLPAPAAIDSEEARAERDLMVAIQEQRTEGQVARCRSEVKVTLAAFARVMGPWFTAENLPRLEQLVKHAEKDTKVFSDAAKNHFLRKRPAAEDPRIQIAVENEDSPSYPSGHATRGIVFATIIAQLAPQQRAALLERGREIGWDRVIAGVHHPSDIIAGRVVGQAVARALLASPQFQKIWLPREPSSSRCKNRNRGPSRHKPAEAGRGTRRASRGSSLTPWYYPGVQGGATTQAGCLRY